MGRGLSALISTDQQPAASDEIREIELDLIRPGSQQPRTNFDQAKLDELAQSIRSTGIIQPLLVRPKGGLFELVAGERRWRGRPRPRTRGSRRGMDPAGARPEAGRHPAAPGQSHTHAHRRHSERAVLRRIISYFPGSLSIPFLPAFSSAAPDRKSGCHGFDSRT